MTIYPKLTSCTASGSWMTVTFDAIQASDSAVLAKGLTVTLPPLNLPLLIEAVRKELSDWMLKNVFGGDPQAALKACITNYSDEDWRVWGI